MSKITPQIKEQGTPEVDPNILPGKKYRFVVKSAEEAVRVIQERMGGKGRVLSVKQLDGQGLSRFLNSPRLEVVSHIPVAEETGADSEGNKSESRKFNITLPDELEDSDENVDLGITDSLGEKEEPAVSDDFKASAPSPTKPSSRTAASRYESTRTDYQSVNLSRVLRSAGFDNVLLAGLENSPLWVKIKDKPTSRALAEVSHWLRRDFERVDRIEIAPRIAFIGTPGVGKTTALCKQITQDVLIGNQNVHVLKVDHETPNPDDALRLFCDVMGVNFHRNPAVIDELSESERVYLDLPGIHRTKKEEWIRIRRLLDEMRVESRVLVINAVYELSLIKDALQMGGEMEVNHLVMTHLDELSQATKLWSIVRKGGLSPWFVSTGQNVAGDYTTDIISSLLERTFPRNIL